MANMADAGAARARFEAAEERHLRGELVPGVQLVGVDAETWSLRHQDLWERANERAPVVDLARLASEEERRAMAGLDAVLAGGLEHRLLLMDGPDVVGAYWGQQQTFGRYYMVNSVVHPGWQRRGIYRALLARVMAAAAASGFREVYSRHRADNNAVIVPKLQAGFAIAGFEIAPRYGLLVHLRWYPGEGMRQAFEYRVDGAHAAALRARGCNLP
jgi:ribosomal protein S18 acetylase RimI-like enzyme